MTSCKFVSSSNDNSVFEMLLLNYALISLNFEGRTLFQQVHCCIRINFCLLKGIETTQPKWHIYAFLGRDPQVENLLYSDYVQATVSLHVHEIQIANVGRLGGREELCFDVYEQNETLGEHYGNDSDSCLLTVQRRQLSPFS